MSIGTLISFATRAPRLTASVSWSVTDVDPRSVRVLRNFSLSGIPVPVAVSDSLRGKSGNGSEALPDVPSIASGGELVALWAEGYGVLDVTVVALIGAPPTPQNP